MEAQRQARQLSIFLADKPPPKAEDRPVVSVVGGMAKRPRERRPKDVPRYKGPSSPLRTTQPFAAQKEFEQWLVRRKEALEQKSLAREADLAKAFEAKIKAAVEARWRGRTRKGVHEKAVHGHRARVAHRPQNEKRAVTAKELDARV